jgi:hypothetical protein
VALARSVPAFAALRRARRRNAVAAVDWIDALYRVYVTAIAGGIALVLLAGATGDEQVGSSTIDDVVDWGPVALGVVVVLAGVVAVRSGRRGGPLVLEPPDVAHVLLAPVARGPVLRSLALRQLRFVVFAGTVAGGVAGYLASRRLPGELAAWTGAGAVQGAVAAAFAMGVGYAAAGRGLAGAAPALVVLARPHLLGAIALWPLENDGADIATGVAGALAAVVALAFGLASLERISIEAVERRSQLVAQLRFAVTLQDIRTALLLRRQLGQERPRRAPWVRLRRRTPLRHSVRRRGWHGVLRWPAVRIVRLVVLGAGAGFALRGAFEGTGPLLAAGGVLLWVAALDAVEPMAQEVDHPDRLDLAPVPAGMVHLRLVLVGAVAMAPAAGAALAAGVLSGDHPGPSALVALITLPPAVLCAVGAAAGAVRGSDPSRRVVGGFTGSPEALGMSVIARMVWPPAIAVAGTLPVLAARAAMRDDRAGGPVEAALAAALPLTVMLGGMLFAYVRFADDARAWWVTRGTPK